MSKYTTELRYICEVNAGLKESADGASVDKIIRTAAPKIFSFSFPIFKESYRLGLECKILRHYYTREICAETYGRWKLFLNDKMNLIMPYYNQLYTSTELKFDPFSDYNITRSGSNSNNTDSSNTDETTTNGGSTSAYSDTPQNGLSDVNNLKYLSAYSKDTNSNATNVITKYKQNTGGSFTENTKGKISGSTYSSMLNEYRTTMLNIDMQVVDELKDLFMNIY